MYPSNNRLFKTILLASSLTLSAVSNAANILQADQFLLDKNFAEAQKAYLVLSESGSAKAFYQLGKIHLEGLGVEQDMLKAVLWFDLAAEQNFADAGQVVADLLKLASPQTHENIIQLQAEFRAQQGWQRIKMRYFPVLKQQTLASKIYFGNKTENQSVPQYHQTASYNSQVELNSIVPDKVKLTGPNPVLNQTQAEFLFGRLSKVDFFKQAYSAIVDYDIAADGSVRNLQVEQKIGYIHPKVWPGLKTFNTSKPQFNQETVAFINRSFIGLAGESEAYIRNQKEDIYAGLVRAARKLKQDPSIEGQFQYAMALTSFEWLAEDKDELEQLLTQLANAGHPLAQYELGFKLYREQKNIAQAIHWLGESAKAGVARAEYRLGHILLNSPWVEKDETKALYWLERAVEQSHIASLLTASELKLLADNETLHNVKTAQDYLTKVPEAQQDNPQYEFLQAMVNFKQTPRKLDQAVNHIQKAIKLGEQLNWDVTDWQAMLTDWTSGGKVSVTDQPLVKL